MIIAEGLESEFEKVKSTMSPKDFAKANIRLGRRRYDNSTEFYYDYFASDPGKLVNAVKKYKQLRGRHRRGELYLADILKG